MMRTINDVNNNVMERSEDELMHGRSEEDEENLVYRWYDKARGATTTTSKDKGRKPVSE